MKKSLYNEFFIFKKWHQSLMEKAVKGNQSTTRGSREKKWNDVTDDGVDISFDQTRFPYDTNKKGSWMERQREKKFIICVFIAGNEGGKCRKMFNVIKQK